MKRILRFFGIGKQPPADCQGEHNCKEIVSKLGELIDGEVDEDTEQLLIKEIQRCPSCLEHYDLDKAFKDFLARKVERKSCAEKVKQDILEKIRIIEA